MLLTNVFLTITLSLLQLCRTDQEIQFQGMLVSEEKSATTGPGFGWSLAMNSMHGNLLIGSPRDGDTEHGGYILTDIRSNGKIFSPHGYYSFGESFDANENFIAVSATQWIDGKSVYSVFIYSATSPYSMVARISVGGKVCLKLTNDNSIIAATQDGYVTIYRYTYHSSWAKRQQMVLENYKAGYYGDISLSVSGNMLAVGYYEQQDPKRGRVNIYSKANNVYVLMKAIPRPHGLDFGVSVSLDDQHLVVSYLRGFFTYMLNPSTGQWINNGHFPIPNLTAMPYVSLRNGLLAATLGSEDLYPEVCAYLYKFSNNNKNNNTNNNNGNGEAWRKVATLKTNGVPIKRNQLHHAVLIVADSEHGAVITGRNDWGGEDYGVVFGHDISPFYDKSH